MSLRIYADDTTGYASDVSPTILQFVINNDLKLLSSWSEHKRLNINNTKTQAVQVRIAGKRLQN